MNDVIQPGLMYLVFDYHPGETFEYKATQCYNLCSTLIQMYNSLFTAMYDELGQMMEFVYGPIFGGFNSIRKRFAQL